MTLKVVVIGTGFGKTAMAPVYESLGCEVTLVPSRDAAAVKAAIQSNCDLVSVHSPPFLHQRHVTAAVSAGRHVLCDKPFGCSAAESEQMLSIAQHAGVRHFLNFEFRCDPGRKKLKQLIDDGAIGVPQHLATRMYLSGGRHRAHGWLFEKGTGGGWIGAYASHVIDMLRWLFGEIDTVSTQPRIDVSLRKDGDARGSTAHPATAEDAVTALFRMVNGVTAVLDTALSAAVDIPGETVVLGSEGAVTLTPGGGLTVQKPGGKAEHVELAGGNPVQTSLQHWLGQVCDAVRDDRQIQPDFHDGVACARVLDRMRSVAVV